MWAIERERERIEAAPSLFPLHDWRMIALIREISALTSGVYAVCVYVKLIRKFTFHRESTETCRTISCGRSYHKIVRIANSQIKFNTTRYLEWNASKRQILTENSLHLHICEWISFFNPNWQWVRQCAIGNSYNGKWGRSSILVCLCVCVRVASPDELSPYTAMEAMRSNWTWAPL